MSLNVKQFNYRARVDKEMRQMWGIDCDDAGVDDERIANALEAGETPREFSERWGEKYDLTPRDEFRASMLGTIYRDNN